MAVTLTTVSAAANSKIVDVEATADGDTTATIPHGIGVAPQDVVLTPLKAKAYLSAWAVTSITSTNVVLTKDTATGSGATGDQLRVIINRPHTIGR